MRAAQQNRETLERASDGRVTQRDYMGQFEYVMVLVSIIIGLGIAHLLLGVGGIVDRLTGLGERLQLSIAHAAWLGSIFTWMVLFWWWEFRLGVLVDQWTVGLYFFLVLYAVVLFLIAVVLVPRSWDGVTDLDEFVINRRGWLFSLYLSATGLDVVDSYLKGGWAYIRDTGAWGWGFWLVAIPLSAAGIRSTRIEHHRLIAVVFLILQVAVGFGALPTLGF